MKVPFSNGGIRHYCYLPHIQDSEFANGESALRE
jgi:hypothetical protein